MLSACVLPGCRPQSPTPDIHAHASVQFDPDPPAVGQTRLTVDLTDDAGQPVRVGQLQVEGNMNHAGMRPVFTRLEETDPGRYTGSIEFTMGGDWFLILSAEVADKGSLQVKVDVPAVKPK
jgi:hypothetical protein